MPVVLVTVAESPRTNPVSRKLPEVRLAMLVPS
jgi:hypothetical protein